MLQRIQTVFLFLSLLVIGILFFLPLMGIKELSGTVWLLLDGGVFQQGTDRLLFATIPLQVILGISILLSGVAIFLFKSRSWQMRLTIYNMVIQLGIIAIIILYTWKAALEVEGSVLLQFATILPIAGFILNLMAFRGIRRDELLIKTLNRIR